MSPQLRGVAKMRRLILICATCILALFYPGAELFCWDTAGDRVGSWSETSCDGYRNSGTWTGYVTSDCRFIGTNQWESVTGKIEFVTKVLTAAGTSPNGCGAMTVTGLLSSDLVSVSGNYTYSKGGGGSFTGGVPP